MASSSSFEERRRPVVSQIELPSISGSTLTTEEDIMTNMESSQHLRSAALMKQSSSSTEPIMHGRSYRASYVRSCLTVQNFCIAVQFINCILISVLIILALQEYPEIEKLKQQVANDQVEIANLEEEVREKQQGQIQALHQEVKDEQQFNFLTLAGILSLLTCLISMFHISTHLQKMNQPNIQRKIIAILWMSPIYSVTSFFTLWFPSIGGWMAIIKDFYEAYCIYTFLSFLIVVLGKGSREQAVDALAKHASRLENPTRCLNRFYNPPPDVSDHAKANAVITECQIYGMQFTFLRPLTTIIFVILNGVSGSKSNSGSSYDETPHSNSMDRDSTETESSSASTGNNTGTRELKYYQDSYLTKIIRWLQGEEGGVSNMNNSTSIALTEGTSSPSQLENTWIPSPSPIEGPFGATFAPTIVSSFVATMAPTVAGHLSGNNNTSGDHTGDFIPTMAPTFGEESDFLTSTKAYLKSPGFALAMVVNVSVFFAFTGLLKFYHAVRDDLAWIRPWPKFLTIKGVVFLTFWQGLAILIFVVVLADPSEKGDATYRALRYQDMLICLEMLFFSITHWCVFPAEEWEPNYQPKEMQKPGLGIKDFVDDVGHIVQNRNVRRKPRRRVTRRKKGSVATGELSDNGTGSYDGFYHQPGMDVPDGLGEEEEEHHHTTVIVSVSAVRFEDLPSTVGLSSPDKRDRSMSDGTGGGFGADDEDSDDLELL
ncbi:organic solute transporter Ost alpha [Nitzschia inconspicua]|uniref:Organic solute transporter Ost alpha n=1 Tax=Nitzschia inconspicua TaxID=303405 RepID=A0A9K3LV61_9STRA|nr:organic solute transporter Ost alpha [Nitzschia inconspicua]